MPRTAVAFAEPRRAGGVARSGRPAVVAPGSRAARGPAVADDPLPSMLDAIYDAGLAPERWPDALAAARRRPGRERRDAPRRPRRRPVPHHRGVRLGRGRLARLRGPLSARSTRSPRAAAKGAAWTAPITAREAAGAGLERTAFFAGWMRPNGFDDALCLDLLPPGERRTAHGQPRIARPPGAPRFGPAEAALLSRLAPHLRRAVEMHRRLSATGAAARAARRSARPLGRRCRPARRRRRPRLGEPDGGAAAAGRRRALRSTATACCGRRRPAPRSALRRLVGAAAGGHRRRAAGAAPVRRAPRSPSTRCRCRPARAPRRRSARPLLPRRRRPARACCCC